MAVPLLLGCLAGNTLGDRGPPTGRAQLRALAGHYCGATKARLLEIDGTFPAPENAVSY